MQDLLVKATLVGAVAFIGFFLVALEATNARWGAEEMCRGGANSKGRKAGIDYGIVHQDVLKFYGSEAKTLPELRQFCRDIGFNPGN